MEKDTFGEILSFIRVCLLFCDFPVGYLTTNTSSLFHEKERSEQMGDQTSS